MTPQDSSATSQPTTEAVEETTEAPTEEVTEEVTEPVEEEITEEVVEEEPATEPETKSVAAAAEPMGPVQMKPAAATAAKTDSESKDYSGTASSVANKTNKVAENALADSSANVQSSFAAQVKRTANIWIWFVLVALILGVATFIVLKRDKKKQSRYQRYASKKKSMKAQLNTKW